MINLSFFTFHMPNPLNPHDRAVNKVLRTINECNNLYINPCNSAYRSGEFLPRLWWFVSFACMLHNPITSPTAFSTSPAWHTLYHGLTTEFLFFSRINTLSRNTSFRISTRLLKWPASTDSSGWVQVVCLLYSSCSHFLQLYGFKRLGSLQDEVCTIFFTATNWHSQVHHLWASSIVSTSLWIAST